MTAIDLKPLKRSTAGDHGGSGVSSIISSSSSPAYPQRKRLQDAGDTRHRSAKRTFVREQGDNEVDPVSCGLCIIPARGGSKRLPGKNIIPLAGRPLLAYTVDAARESGLFERIIVSSDDRKILAIAADCGAEPRQRPAGLAGDTAQVKTVCRELLMELAEEGETYREFAVLLVTNPLRTAGDLRAAHRLFKERGEDFMMSLAAFAHPPQRAVRVKDGLLEPFIDAEQMKQTQLLEPLYRHDGSFIFGRVAAFLAGGEFYGAGVVPYIMPPERSVDIDGPLDLKWAEFLLGQGGGG